MRGDVPLSTFGPGSGSMGLNGDFTPPSRFIRAAYGKQNIQGIDNEEEGISVIFVFCKIVRFQKEE